MTAFSARVRLCASTSLRVAKTTTEAAADKEEVVVAVMIGEAEEAAEVEEEEGAVDTMEEVRDFWGWGVPPFTRHMVK